MAKRFTDNEKWKKQFFKGLSTVNKLFFIYILDECDNAGIWHVEPEIAEIRIGEKINLQLAKKQLGKHIIEIDDGEKWFIPSFIQFQYGQLNPNVKAHKSVLDKLQQKNLIQTYEQLINCSQEVKDKDMDKVKDKDKVKSIAEEIPTNIQQMFIKTLGRNPKIPEVEETQKLINQYGRENVHQILKVAALRGINSFNYLQSQLEISNGKLQLKPYNGNGKQATPRRELNDL